MHYVGRQEMKKAILTLMSSVALLGAQTAAATEAYIAPAAPWSFSGTVNVNKGIALTCNVTVDLSGPDDASDTSPPFSHTDVANLSADITLSGGFLGLCASVSVDPVPAGNISYAGGTFTLHDVFVQTITSGDCQGDLVGTWNGGAQTLSVSGSLPPATGGNACTMSGTLDLDSPASGEISDPTDPGHAPHQ